MGFVDVKVKRVVRLRRVVRMAAQRLGPADDFAHVFDQRFAFRQVLQCEHAFAMYARAAGLNPAAVAARRGR